MYAPSASPTGMSAPQGQSPSLQSPPPECLVCTSHSIHVCWQGEPFPPQVLPPLSWSPGFWVLGFLFFLTRQWVSKHRATEVSQEGLMEEVISAGMSQWCLAKERERMERWERAKHRGGYGPCRRSNQLGVPKSTKGKRSQVDVGKQAGDSDKEPWMSCQKTWILSYSSVTICANCSSLPLQRESSHRRYVNECTWLCSNKTLLMGIEISISHNFM